MGKLRRNLEYRLIAGLLHARVKCVVCGWPCWTRVGSYFDPGWYRCLDCGQVPVGQERSRELVVRKGLVE